MVGFVILYSSDWFFVFKEYSNYIAYIAKDNESRICYVFQCASNNLANKIVHEIRNTFELRALADAHIQSFNKKFQSSTLTPKTERRVERKIQLGLLTSWEKIN